MLVKATSFYLFLLTVIHTGEIWRPNHPCCFADPNTGPVATGHSEAVPSKFCRAQENLFKIYNKNKNLTPLQMYFAPPNLKT